MVSLNTLRLCRIACLFFLVVVTGIAPASTQVTGTTDSHKTPAGLDVPIALARQRAVV